MEKFARAETLLKRFKSDRYLHGLNVLAQVGSIAAQEGKRAVLVRDTFPGADLFVQTIKDSVRRAGVELLAEIPGAAPNAPREDLARIAYALVQFQPDVLISFGGGSTIDATKAAEVLRALGGAIEDYFGTGLVTKKLQETGKELAPHIAIQTAASSGAHLTKYSNITDIQSGQKKLIVDLALVPRRPVFDYGVTFGAPFALTADGALDGISHCLEVAYSAVGKPEYPLTEEIASEGIRLVVEYLPKVLDNPRDPEGRCALGVATDLGGYSIMVGGTNGAHLTSFSLVDVLSHGRACGMLNPYYTVFFAPAVPQPLELTGKIYRDHGYTQAPIENLRGRELGIAVAEAMTCLESKIGFPTRLADVPGFTDAHIERALMAAKNPQLKMKLENMPIPMTAEMVDEYMGPILRSAKTGDFGLIKNVT